MGILINSVIIDYLLEFAKSRHPYEVILLLRARANGDIEVMDVVFPPFGSGGGNFAHFPSHALPIDFSIIGTAHSHPIGNPRPSNMDLRNIYSRIMIIMAYPYRPQDISAFNKKGEAISISIK